MSNWQPIETAPKDWSDIILWCDNADDGDDVPHEGFFSCEDGGTGQWHFSYGNQPPCEPTHWQPLPDPPDLHHPDTCPFCVASRRI